MRPIRWSQAPRGIDLHLVINYNVKIGRIAASLWKRSEPFVCRLFVTMRHGNEVDTFAAFSDLPKIQKCLLSERTSTVAEKGYNSPDSIL